MDIDAVNVCVPEYCKKEKILTHQPLSVIAKKNIGGFLAINLRNMVFSNVRFVFFQVTLLTNGMYDIENERTKMKRKSNKNSGEKITGI